MTPAAPGPARPLDDLLRGIWRENPVFVQVLGMCPTLAVSNSALNALTMGLATTFVLCLSSVLISLLRHAVPREVRIASFVLVIATFVTVVDYLIQAISLQLHAALGAFISLIVVNCIILGRAEAFAARNGPLRSFLDGLGMGLGFTLALACLGAVRELLGSGSLLGIGVFGSDFEPWTVMILPSGGFFTLGAWLLAIAWWRRRRDAAALARETR
ncbi:MAG: electron transport complex subunit E [Pseudomonadales bacterium]|nr:electron transport complex subunit E [Pseudomonadales bacterium]MBP9035410.1 electron transport complex subunit E [Pseudomonadales bacterium]